MEAIKSCEVDLEAGFDELSDAAGPSGVVCAGDFIEADVDDGFLRGHGTQPAGVTLRATQCGVVQRVNKLISVQPVQQRYAAELGDVVVGRVTEIAAKRWKLDLQSRQEASLHLSAVNLPGGVQRRRTIEDELNMRTVFVEGDLISAEVQSLYSDGSVALQTRSVKCGKLERGQLVCVPARLVVRQKQHFTTVQGTGVALVLGVNGLVWVGLDQGVVLDPAGDAALTQAHQEVARVANTIKVLARLNLPITPPRIQAMYQEGLKSCPAARAMLHQDFLGAVLAKEVAGRS